MRLAPCKPQPFCCLLPEGKRCADVCGACTSASLQSTLQMMYHFHRWRCVHGLPCITSVAELLRGPKNCLCWKPWSKLVWDRAEQTSALAYILMCSSWVWWTPHEQNPTSCRVLPSSFNGKEIVHRLPHEPR